MRMLPALACPILLLGRVDAAHPRVHREGRNWLVAQDLIGACHMHTCVHKKIPRHMKLCAHTRNTTNSPVKIAFSASLQRQRDASFSHCQGHNGWRLPHRMHVYAGGSDHMLYQHITVLTPVITASCSSIQPSFLAFIVVIVLFWRFDDGEDAVFKKYPKVHFSRRFKIGGMFVLKKSSPREFFSLTCRYSKSTSAKIWRFLQYEECTFPDYCKSSIYWEWELIIPGVHSHGN